MKNLLILGISLVVIVLSCKNPTSTNKNQDTTPIDTIVEVVMPYDTFSYSAYDEIACFLAGVEYKDTSILLSSQFASKEWIKYSKDFSANWNKFDSTVLREVRVWSNENLTHTDSMFYPFSGPDFNYLDAMFPNTRYSVLIGLEKTGSIPDIASYCEDSTKSFLLQLQNSLYYNLEFSFFRTKGMAKELNSELLDGTIPLIMLFIKRHNFEILNIYPVEINKQGILYADTIQIYAKDYKKDFKNGVAFIYKNNSDTLTRQLVYLSKDISNGALDTIIFDSFCTNYITGHTCFLKAASYLCHIPEFTIIRDQLLEKSAQIVTDPSGMPYRHFDNTWDVNLHGNYVEPIKLFHGRMQPDLRDTCINRNCKNLPFRFGYHYTQWCLIDAHKKIQE